MIDFDVFKLIKFLGCRNPCQFAEKLEIDPSVVYRYIRARKVGYSLLCMVSEYADVSVKQLKAL